MFMLVELRSLKLLAWLTSNPIVPHGVSRALAPSIGLRAKHPTDDNVRIIRPWFLVADEISPQPKR